MNKISLAARSVSLAAAMGLAVTVGAPAVIAQPDSPINDAAGNSPLVNKDAHGALTIHKFGNPTAEGTPSGTAQDARDVENNGGEPLGGVGFTVYKINKTADGSTDIDVTTNDGLLAASKLKAADFSQGAALKSGLPGDVLTQVATGETKEDGKWVVSEDLPLGAYLVVETGPLEGWDPAVPFIAFVPMTADNGPGQQGTTWNYDVHAFPKNYQDEKPSKTVTDKDKNAGDEGLTYEVTGTARQLRPGNERTQFQITDQIDPKLDITSVTAKIVRQGGGEEELTTNDVIGGSFYTGNNVDVNLTPEKAKSLNTGDKVVVNIETRLKAEFRDATEIAPNTALVYQNNPDGSEDQTPRPTPTVKTYWGGLQFKKVDTNGNALEDAEFQIARLPANQKCDSIDTSKLQDAWTPVNGQQNGAVTQTFRSGADGMVKVTGLHVNDFENNAEVAEQDRSRYCLIEVKAPAGKELLPEAIEFQLIADDVITEENGETTRKYDLASVQLGPKEGEVVNNDDTTPNLPMTGGMGIGILAAIGAALAAAGAWFARRGAKN